MIKLVVDSTFGLTKEYTQKEDIQVVNLKIILNEKTTDEGRPDTWDKFYEELEKSEGFPTTSLPSPQDFIDAIQKVYDKEPDAQVLVLTISERLSGTVNSAMLAGKSFEDKQVVVMDSRQVTVGSKLLVEEVVNKINSGASFEEVIEFTKEIQKKIEVQFVPATMESLKRSGRIDKISATIASILKIKPLFKFKDGKISVSKKVLGITKAANDMVRSIPEDFEKVKIAYIHSKENLQLIENKLKEIKGLENVEMWPVCPVFGVHVGIGAIGIVFL